MLMKNISWPWLYFLPIVVKIPKDRWAKSNSTKHWYDYWL
jgi:hypothetical protein